MDLPSGNCVLAQTIWNVLQSQFVNQRDTRHAARITKILQRHGFVRKQPRVWVELIEKVRDEKGNVTPVISKVQMTCWLKTEVWQDNAVVYNNLKVVQWERGDVPDFIPVQVMAPSA